MRKSGFISIIGRPNAGKSTLMNTICGKKIAIVSHIPQTTRNVIKGIYTKKDTQMVFLDTPGIHESVKQFNQIMSKQAHIAMDESDLVLYVIDLTRRFGKEEEIILAALQELGKPVIVACNKVDVQDEHVVENSMRINAEMEKNPTWSLIYISALKQKNIDELLAAITEKLPEGEFYFPDDMYTDSALDFMVAETVREKVMLQTYEEIPHAVRVETVEIDDSDPKFVSVFVDIFVERDSQKGMVIGNGGIKLKHIGMDARRELEDLFKKKVFLKLNVRIDKNWRMHA
ncbi:GTPase Era [Candidatus Gracilibacteria bacterium CG17_big_fil_post_rev_8_21_14_2_50_48_13]|nr:MAG: GTPase Era [Candidatus Gracilibacteria bacterium CG17_big_fil_post_rev_8_21_14_2_50_48_13]